MRSFKIKKKLLPIIFKLELLKDSKLHSVFYAVLLEIESQQILIATTLQTEREKEYKIKEILNSKKILTR